MKKIKLLFIILSCLFLYAGEQDTDSKTQEQTSKEQTQENQEEMTHAQQLWGRKFQAGLGYTYFNTGHHGIQISYGMWDLNKMGILAEIVYPIAYTKQSKLYLVSFYWLWDWAPIPQFSLIPKVGYGPKIYQTKKGDYLSWEPLVGVDLSYNINAFVKLYASYTWSMFKDDRKNITQLHGGSLGIRIAY